MERESDRCYPFVRLDDSDKDRCTNCSKLYDPVNGILRQTLLQWYDQVDCTNKNIKIVEAVVLVFEGLLNMNEKRISPLDDISMCSECVYNMAELYGNYRQFMERSVPTSYFKRVFSKCMLWRPGTKSNTDCKRKSGAKSRDKEEVKVKQTDNGNNTAYKLIPTPKVTRNSCTIEYDAPKALDTELDIATVELKEEPIDEFDDTNIYEDNFLVENDEDNDDDDDYIPSDDEDFDNNECTDKASKIPKRKIYNTATYKIKSVPKSFPEGKVKVRRSAKDNNTVHTQAPTPRVTRNSCKIEKDERAASDTDFDPVKTESLNEFEEIKHFDDNFPTAADEYILPDSDLNQVQVANAERFLPMGTLEPDETASMEDEYAPILCENCAESCNGRESLREHMEMYHPEEMTYKCAFCAVDFSDRSNFREHMISNHKEEKTNKCETCGESFASVPSLSLHINKVHTANVLPEIAISHSHMCTQCNKGFPTVAFLKVHEKRVHPSNPLGFMCDVCGKCKTSYAALYSHKKSHTDERPHACNVCDKKYKTATQLRIHERIHSGIKDYVCEICSKRFYDLTSLNSHFKRHEIAVKKPAVDKPFKCNSCSKSFNVKKTLKNHKRTHEEESPFACKICNKTFKSNNYLKQHEICHTKPFACSTCKSRFELEDALINHQSIHICEKNKPYKCDNCDMAFWTFALLDSHILRTHSKKKEQPYKCGICPPRFGMPDELKSHEETHKNQRINDGDSNDDANEHFESEEGCDVGDCVVYL